MCALSYFILLFLSGCGSQPQESLAQAYIAPASVNLRSQLNQKNSNVAVLKHGDPVSIVDVRRRYVKVRTSKGAEGWLDSLDLLSADDMQRVKRERQQNAGLPSEGAATAYETLNIHLDPSRKSPAFAQIAEGASVNILAHRLSPKAAAAPR
ncbi:MAG: SH3 domain-containing protein, partial [Acidobacteriota bacterium]|nr:SH3 domain-containing protein [Acidobacteriota bacterium]